LAASGLPGAGIGAASRWLEKGRSITVPRDDKTGGGETVAADLTPARRARRRRMPPGEGAAPASGRCRLRQGSARRPP
jgi:hypothetical protein